VLLANQLQNPTRLSAKHRAYTTLVQWIPRGGWRSGSLLHYHCLFVINLLELDNREAPVVPPAVTTNPNQVPLIYTFRNMPKEAARTTQLFSRAEKEAKMPIRSRGGRVHGNCQGTGHPCAKPPQSAYKQDRPSTVHLLCVHRTFGRKCIYMSGTQSTMRKPRHDLVEEVTRAVLWRGYSASRPKKYRSCSETRKMMSVWGPRRA
jgi:hypothetical protein